MSQPTLTEKFAALSQREKVLTFVSGVSLILLVGFTFFIEPAIDDLSHYKKELAAEEVKRQTLNTQQPLFLDALSTDPNAEKQAELASLASQQTALSVTFAKQLSELVSPADMVLLVEQVFSHANALTLLEMASVAPESVFEGNDEMQDVALYQHGVQMTFRGKYFDVTNFIESLESQSEQLYWRAIHYQVADYPLAQVTVEVYTLSTEKAFIGVK